MPPALGTILLTWQHGQVLLQRHETPFVDDGMNKPKSYEVRNRSVKATPDLNRELLISVGNAGPQLRAPDPSGQRRSSTASSRSQWATPDLNRELQIPEGLLVFGGVLVVSPWSLGAPCDVSVLFVRVCLGSLLDGHVSIALRRTMVVLRWDPTGTLAVFGWALACPGDAWALCCWCLIVSVQGLSDVWTLS
eukprot:s805_g14.t1